jgi:hypothetical protein
LLEEDPALDEEKVRQGVYGDYDLFSFEWECFCDNIGEMLEAISPKGYWLIAAHSLGWTRRRGHKFINLKSVNDGHEFLGLITPNTNFNLTIDELGDHLDISISHHDGTDSMTAYPMRVHPEDLESAFGQLENMSFEWRNAKLALLENDLETAAYHIDALEDTLSDLCYHIEEDVPAVDKAHRITDAAYQAVKLLEKYRFELEHTEVWYGEDLWSEIRKLAFENPALFKRVIEEWER